MSAPEQQPPRPNPELSDSEYFSTLAKRVVCVAGFVTAAASVAYTAYELRVDNTAEDLLPYASQHEQHTIQEELNDKDTFYGFLGVGTGFLIGARTVRSFTVSLKRTPPADKA